MFTKIRISSAAFLAVALTVGMANAQFTLFPNGDFEGTGEWSTGVDGAGTTATFETTGGNPAGYASINSAVPSAGAWGGVIFSSEDADGGPVPLSVLGLTAGQEYTFQWDSRGDATGNTMASSAIKFESYTGDVEIGAANTGDIAYATTTDWATYTHDYTIDPAADGIKMVFVGLGTGISGYDNAGVIVVPEPASMGMVLLGVIGWIGLRRRS